MLPETVKTIDPLMLELSGTWPGKVLISSPQLPRRLRVSHSVVSILFSARTGIRTADHPCDVITTLVEAGFLIDATADPGPAGPPWDAWGTMAWSFYAQTKNIQFIGNDPAKIDADGANFAKSKRPSSIRPAVSDRVLLLPRVRSRLDIPYREVLEGRRTHRHFEDAEMDLDSFSDLLHYTFAPLRFADADEMGVLQLRAAASGGARHECEAFVFVFNVASVRPGLYYYDNIRHGLEPINADAGRAELEHLTFNQGFFIHASFGVLTAAVAERLSWKYPHPAAYRMLLHNIGHMAQVFSMTATALGFGAALTGAIRGSEADVLLQLRQHGEFTTFALACGLPARRPDGLPKSIRLPADAPEYY